CRCPGRPGRLVDLPATRDRQGLERTLRPACMGVNPVMVHSRQPGQEYSPGSDALHGTTRPLATRCGDPGRFARGHDLAPRRSCEPHCRSCAIQLMQSPMSWGACTLAAMTA